MLLVQYTLERDGVVEKRVEKRIVEEAEDETDYDKACHVVSDNECNNISCL